MSVKNILQGSLGSWKITLDALWPVFFVEDIPILIVGACRVVSCGVIVRVQSVPVRTLVLDLIPQLIIRTLAGQNETRFLWRQRRHGASRVYTNGRE